MELPRLLLVVVVVLVASAKAGAKDAAAEDAVNRDPESYSGYQVLSLSVDPSQDGAALLRQLLQRPGLGVDVWGRREDGDVAVMVPAGILDEFVAVLNASATRHAVLWPDAQRVLDAEAKARADSPRAEAVDADGGVTFKRFMRYDEVQGYVRRLAARHPGLVTLEALGHSWEGRELTAVRVSRAPRGAKAKRTLLLDAGVHAREWVAPAAALYVLHQLTEAADEATRRQLLDDLDWYIVPVLNPDGYEYSHTTNRLWRKNRSNYSDPWCRGVDLNRNFDFHWREVGASDHPCDITFAGNRAFSEPETQLYRDFVLDKNKDKSVKMYLTFHSWGWYVLYPWGFTADPPEDAAELQSIGEEANRAMVGAGAKAFRVGTSTNVLYPASGGSDDWVKGVAGVDKAFTIELPGGGANGFDLEEARIEETVRHVFEGVRAFAARARTL